MAGSLEGQAAIVTGAGRGFGKAIALGLAAEGAAVAVMARTRAQLDETVAEIEAAGGHGYAIAGDVTDRDDVFRAVYEAETQLGALTLVVSNAGVPWPFGPIWAVDPDQWWAAQGVHIRAPFLLMNAALPGMTERGRGRVILVSALGAYLVAPNLSGYCTGKAAQNRLAELAAAETRPFGVQVFAIDPGFVVTQLSEDTMNSPDAQRWLPGMVERLRAAKGQADGERDLARCAQRCVDLASGKYDALSGKYLELDDDLAALSRGDAPRRPSKQG